MAQRYISLLLLIAPWAVCTTTTAQENQLELGFRPLVLVSQGEPANDMLGGGIVGTLHWKGDWYFGAALDFMKFDYERPQNLLGIAQPPNTKAVDGTDDFTRLSGWIERRYNHDRAWNWFWNAGLGYASPDPGIVTGDTASGGTYNIVTDASDEIHLMGSIGLRRELGSDWTLTTTFHLEHHLTDYKIVDTVSGATGKIGSHTPVGVSVTFSFQF